jgi:hypothetical protein
MGPFNSNSPFRESKSVDENAASRRLGLSKNWTPALSGGGAENSSVTFPPANYSVATERNIPMTLIMVMVFNILVALALGFVLGRVYQIRRYELERREDSTLLPTAHISRP